MVGGALPIFYVLYALVADFWLRVAIQRPIVLRTDAYALLPVARSVVTHHFVLRAVAAPYNVFEVMFVALPFACGCGVWNVMPVLCAMTVFNGLCYQAVRLLMGRSVIWIVVVGAVHILLLASAMQHYACCPLSVVWVLGAAVLAYVATYALAYNMREEQQEMSVVRRSYFGVMPILRLEWLLRTRNVLVRKAHLAVLLCMALLCVVAALGNAAGMQMSFTCLYCYMVPGMLMLTDVMSHEGNYMECLVMRRGSIYQLLSAKYFFSVAQLSMAFVMLLPAVAVGKLPVMQSVAYMAFAAGVVFPLLMTTAPYNTQARALHRSRRVSASFSYQQGFVAMVVMTMPLMMERALTWCVGVTFGYVVLVVAGCIGIGLRRWWLPKVCRHIMQRRHIMMEGFRATRE